MKRLTRNAHVNRAAVIASLDSKRPQLFSARLAIISRMSGYPYPLHSIGRLQKTIKLDSFQSLLSSLKQAGNIAHATAEVIESMDGTKVDKYQMDRTEIVAYVTNITEATNTYEFSENEIDLIAHLVTSFEANPSAWMLKGGDGEDDLHSQILNLYREVLDKAEGSNLPVFNSHDNKICKFIDLPQNRERTKKKGKAKAKKEADGADTIEADDVINTEIVLYRYASVRVIDHVYQLLLDKDAWYHFVSPRVKADVTNNLERAKSLRLFSVYCHNLLVYYQFFAIESFLKAYDLVQKWVMHFPPLDAQTTQDLEGLIRKYDMLNAQRDVDSLLDSFSSSGEVDLGALVFPSEFIANYGLANTVKSISDKAGDFSLVGDLSNLGDLDQPKYLPLITGVSASALDITYQVSEVVLIGKIVSEEVRKTVAVLLPSLTGSASENTVDRFKSLNVSASLPFKIPHATSWQVDAGVEKGISGGVLKLDSASPLFSSEYHSFVREKLRFKLITDRLVSSMYSGFTSPQLIDSDKAAHLRSIMNYQWRTMAPDFMVAGDRYYTQASIAATSSDIKSLIESLSGLNYETVIIEMSLPHIRAVWATYFSGFALLYVDRNLANSVTLLDTNTQLAVSDAGSYDLVQGHGKPWGTEYSSLEQLQGTLTDETKLIHLGRGMYLRLLTKVPLITDDLRRNELFYSQEAVSYFSSNSKFAEVSRWVFTEGLFNFALFPMPRTHFVPDVKFTPKYAYVTQALFISTELFYKPSAPDKAREVYDLAYTETEWKDEKRQYFLTYRHFGPYMKPAASVQVDEIDDTVTEAVKKIEQSIKADEQQQSESTTGAGHKAAHVANEIATDVDEAVKKSGKVIDENAKDEGKTKL